MAITLVETVGSATANTYATRVETDAYAEGTAWAATWAAATAAAKDAFLVRAVRALDAGVTYQGRRHSATQAMEWPRYGVLDPSDMVYDTTVIPAAVKQAQMHLACWLATQTGDDPFGANTTASLAALSAGAVSLTFREGIPAAGPLFFGDVIVPMLRAGRCITSGSPLVR